MIAFLQPTTPNQIKLAEDMKLNVLQLFPPPSPQKGKVEHCTSTNNIQDGRHAKMNLLA